MRGDIKRALEQHNENLRDVVRGFKGLMEMDKSTAPTSAVVEAKRGSWKLAPFRQSMREEMQGLVKKWLRRQEPQDFEWRIARLSIAMYLLEKSDELLEAALAQKSTTMNAYFISAHNAIQHILDNRYFSKSNRQVINDFLDGEVAITTCAECAGVKLMTLESAIRNYKMKVAAELDAMLAAA